MDDLRRLRWRILGWGGATALSLAVWLGLIWFVGQAFDRRADCRAGVQAEAAAEAACPLPGGW